MSTVIPSSFQLPIPTTVFDPNVTFALLPTLKAILGFLL
jgi:hypothetical protein